MRPRYSKGSMNRLPVLIAVTWNFLIIAEKSSIAIGRCVKLITLFQHLSENKIIHQDQQNFNNHA